MDGEQLDVKEINKINPTEAATKKLFTEFTGVQFPEKVSNEQLYNIYRSAHQVQQAQAAQVEAQLQASQPVATGSAETTVGAPVADSPAVEAPAVEAPAVENSFTLGGETIPYAEGTRDRARQVMAEAMGEIGGDGKPLETITQFKEAYRSRFPKATDNEVALAYQQYLKDAGTIDLGIEGVPRMRRDEFLKLAGEISGSGSSTERELRYLYDEIQQANKEGYTGREKLSLSEEEREASRKARSEGKSVEQAVREAQETTRRRELESARARIQSILGKGYGVKEVKVVYDAEGDLARANASIDNGVLTFNGDKVDSAWAMYWTLGHELTHPASTGDATLTADILSTFQSLEQGGFYKDAHGSIDAHRESLAKLYQPIYEKQETEQTFEQYLDEELAADLMRTAFQHQRTLDRLASRTPDILEQASTKLQAMLSGFKKGEDMRTLAQAKSALESLSVRLEKALEANKTAAHTDGEAKFSIKRTSQMTLAEQLKMFYDGKMASSDAFYFGETPAALEKAGISTLPLAFTQADFKKSTKGKHNVPRRVLKNLSNDLETALFAFGSGDRIGILTGDIDGDGKPLLVGIQTAVQMDADKVNAIHSAYGLDNPGAWLKNQIESGKTFHLLDEKRANTFLYPYGYLASRKEGISSIQRAGADPQAYGYSASAGDGIRSTGEIVTQNGTEVKTKFSLTEDNRGRKLTEAQQEFFQDSKVVDKDGNLIVLYRGHRRGSTVYGTDYRGAIWSTTERNYAEGYGDVDELYANITNPYKQTVLVGTNHSNGYDIDKAIADAHNQGHDGAIITFAYDIDSRAANYAKFMAEAKPSTPANEVLSFTPTLPGETIGEFMERASAGPLEQHVVAFNSNQFKSTDNQNPTKRPDIRYSISEDGRVLTTPTGVEIIQNPTDSEYRQLRDEALQEMPWLRGTGEPMLRHTYDEQGNTYYWRADRAMHVNAEPYINKQYKTRTSQQWKWWESPYKDEYPVSYDLSRFSLADETKDVDRLDLKAHNETGNLTEEVRENGISQPEGSQVESVRDGRDAGRAAGSVQRGSVREDRRGDVEEKRSDRRADLGVSSVELKSDPKPHLFARALSAAIKANPNGEMVDFHDSMELSKMKRFLSENGGYGVAVEKDGNITAVFNNRDVSGRGGVIRDLLGTALDNGGTKLDCYATYAPHDLSAKYSQLGFVPVAWMRFNPEYAKDGWHHGSPDVVFFVHNGDPTATVMEKYGTYPTYTAEDIHRLPEFTDYDDAKAYQERQVQEITKQKKPAADEQSDGGLSDTSGARFSIEQTPDGRSYVKADRQVLSGDDPAKWGQQLQAYINAEIRKGQDILLPTVDGMLVRLTERSAYKLADRKATDLKTHTKHELPVGKYRVKENAAAHIDEIILTGEFKQHTEDIGGVHENDIGEDGFNTYVAYFEDHDGQYYRLQFTSALNGNEETAYSIADIQKRKKPSTSNGSSVRENGALSGSGLSTDSVSDSSGNVNGKFSFTPEFTENFVKWYKEQYGDSDLTEAQLKRAMQRAEARALRAEESRQAEATLHKQELQNKDTAWQIYATVQQRNDRRSARERVKAVQAAAKQDRRDQQAIHAVELSVARDEKVKALRNTDTAWQIEHTRKMREQAAESRAKLADAKRIAQREKENAVRETREIERAEAAVQHDADRMNERRRAAARLHRSETTWQQKTDDLKEKGKLGRKAARDALHESAEASKKRAKETAEQAVVSTLRQDPDAMRKIRTLQSEASKLRTLGRTAYRNFVNVAEAIDRLAQKQPDGIRASTLVTTLGASATTVERIYKDGLVARDGSRIGESMRETFLCLDEKGKTVDESKQALLQDYLLHRHNQDRMDLEGRALRKLEAFETENPWLAEMPREEFARLVAMTEAEQEKQGKKDAHDRAVQYAGLLKEFTESHNKPIFADSKGNAVTAETSRIIADQYLAENPWLEEKAQSIYTWWDRFMQEWAVGDSISQAEYERMRETYPHYVPTYRAQKNGVGAANFVGAGGANVSKAVKKAKGSFLEVMRVEDSFSNLVSKIVRLERTNELYKNLIDTAIVDPDSVADMIQVDWDTVDQQTQQQFGLDDVQAAAENAETTGIQKTKDGYKLTAWYGGHQVSAYVNEELYKSIAGVTGNLANDLERNLLRVGNALTGPMKTAITGINPNFAMRNVSRDLPTAVINSISGMAFPKYWAKAAAEMAKQSEAWQTYQALGGTHAGYYNDSKGFAKGMEKGFSGRNVIGKMGFINEFTEAQTRFAEYLATIDRLGDTYENRLLGIKNSAEVTVDFSRKGRYGKVINAWVPYWNPAVQGIDKVVRSVIEAPDVKSRWIKASKTLARAAMTTILVEAVQYAILKATDRDDDWEELSDRTKDTYYCIPLKNHTFLKIPKNREWGAILGTPFMRLLEYKDGRENPFENYLETSIIPNFLPGAILRPTSDGFESDIIGVSQALDLAKNEDFAGRTIVPYAYQQGSKSQQYDSETSWLSRAIGERLNFSPMQLDYLIGDYFGDFGDLFIKATAPATWSGDENAKDLGESALDTLVSPWLADSRYSNQRVSDYYEMTDQLSRVVQDRKNQLGTAAAQETKEYKTQKALNALYGAKISDLNKTIRDMADGEEKDALKGQIAQLAGEALTFYQDCMDGKIPNPQLTADYADLSTAVSDELIRLDALSEEYKFKPTGSPSSKYTDPKHKNREYILTGDDEAKAKYKEIYLQVYEELTEELMGRDRYRKAKDNRKAELLEGNREKVLAETRDQFLDWLAENRTSTKKKK